MFKGFTFFHTKCQPSQQSTSKTFPPQTWKYPRNSTLHKASLWRSNITTRLQLLSVAHCPLNKMIGDAGAVSDWTGSSRRHRKPRPHQQISHAGSRCSDHRIVVNGTWEAESHSALGSCSQKAGRIMSHSGGPQPSLDPKRVPRWDRGFLSSCDPRERKIKTSQNSFFPHFPWKV